MRVAVVGVGLIGGSIGLAARERLGATRGRLRPRPSVVGAAALARGAVEAMAASIEAAVGGGRAGVRRGAGRARSAARSTQVLAAAPARLRGQRRRLDQARGRRRPRGPALHRRPPARRRRDLGSRARPRRPLRRRDLVPDARARRPRGRSTSACTARSSGSAPSRRRSTPTLHDRVMASVSHLPHVFANVLVAQAARALGDGEEVPATGPSFRDATRVAGASATIWPDIYLSNRDALVALIDETQTPPGGVRDALARADRAEIERWNDEARARPRRAARAPGSSAGPSTSCAPRSPTAPASSPRSRSRSGAPASTSSTSRSRPRATAARASSRCGFAARSRRRAPRR